MNEEDVLMGFKKEILQSNRDYICQHLQPELHFEYLCHENVLSKDDCEVIENESSNEKKASKFLDIIISKGPNSFDHLCAALQAERTQLFLFERLNEKYEIKKQFFLDLCAAKDGKPRRVPTSLPIASIDLTPSSCVEPQQSGNS